MESYRDPDDAPVDPVLKEDHREARESRRPFPEAPGAIDPDALRPAHVGGDDEPPIEPDDGRAVARFG